LREEINKPPPRIQTVLENKYGSDLWLPIVVRRSTSGPFYDAVWELCRVGVLRPGQTAPMGMNMPGQGFQGDGFSLTEFGRGWVQIAAQHPPSDPSRFSEVLQPFIGRFGEGFAQRAAEASRCYRTTNYLACCVMAGAAAESILLA